MQVLVNEVGDPLLRHNNREGNEVAYVLSQQGAHNLVATNFQVFLYPPLWVFTIFQQDREEHSTCKTFFFHVCNRLANLGNSILQSLL